MNKKSIRVLHVIGQMNRGGAEAMIMNLYRKIDREIVQFDFVEHIEEECAFDKEIKSLGGKIYHCPHFNGKNYFEYKTWWNNFFQNDGKEYRIVHGHIGSTAAIYLKIANKYDKYTIAHSHSSGTDHSLSQHLYNILSYNTRNIADYFFACSEQAGLDRYGKKTKFSVLNNAIDTNNYLYNDKVRQRIREEFSVDKNTLVVGHVGRLISVKNHSFLIDIFTDVVKMVPSAKLFIVGDGELREEIEKRIADLHLQDKVILTGVRSDVNDLMQAMDVFVFPSIYEGLPVTLVEAQASGLPCIISDGVPIECKLTDLVSQMKLSDGASAWAEKALELSNSKRTNRFDEIKQAGYDIHTTAKWLEEFYLEKAK